MRLLRTNSVPDGVWSLGRLIFLLDTFEYWFHMHVAWQGKVRYWSLGFTQRRGGQWPRISARAERYDMVRSSQAGI